MKEQYNDRRGFLKKLSIGGLSLAGLASAPIEDVLAYSTQKV
ncbi:MAG: twin-arginine translocation signal domain-containing protein, partial [Cyclobacteriaceae bacterium]|nr:twin-arginine translocation signal domain-containing protein [Cyclobacteriaceae bacterium]